MRWPEPAPARRRGRLARALRRVEVRAALAAGLAVSALLALQASALYLFVAGEYVEEAQRYLHQQAMLLAGELAQEGGSTVTDALAASMARTGGVAVRIARADGTVLRAFGTPPEPAPATSLLAALGVPLRLADAPGHVEERIARPDGTVVELALPLAHTHREIREVRTGLLAILLVSFAGGVALVLVAVRSSFAPLREGTQRLEAAGAGNLGLRLPERGTGDPVDRHAAALNAALERVADAFARLRAFSTDAAHEMRTPVHRIHSAAELALMDPEASAAPETTREALQTVMESADELTRVIDALLLLARLEEDGQLLQRRALALGPWIERLLDLYRPLCAERGIALREAIEPATLAGDPALLDRLVCNLVDNAVRHGGCGGRIEVTGGPTSEGIELRVADAGPGVPSGDRERIFDRFRRLDPGRAGSGSGIGLALARAIARAHGGTLRAVDTPLGGACLVLQLPTIEPDRGGG